MHGVSQVADSGVTQNASGHNHARSIWCTGLALAPCRYVVLRWTRSSPTPLNKGCAQRQHALLLRTVYSVGSHRACLVLPSCAPDEPTVPDCSFCVAPTAEEPSHHLQDKFRKQQSTIEGRALDHCMAAGALPLPRGPHMTRTISASLHMHSTRTRDRAGASAASPRR